MPHIKISPLDNRTENPGLSLPNTDFIMEIVAVHDGQLIHDIINSQLI